MGRPPDGVMAYSTSSPASGRSRTPHEGKEPASKASEKAAANPMISPQELAKLAEDDFKSPEDIRLLIERRKAEFDKEWVIDPKSEDDFDPLTR
ncbi:hypothetical protein [Methylobacterium brachythecii]|uniref:Uncharacterized protein n=1 Tax=Methylobacterium brachythecii TaxID=1176177 RepID=A0A7W6AIT2_9HYPH|nr:hypothetical protein [Methylobacterium brachythecii]MBB3904135.1 hypothetical protein [Methylobacterium brachythecii]GLS42877.1 hypothetical protein GCM10007884_08620 [Methylobacterium brachythecii]